LAERPRVLLLGSNERSALSVTRSLGRAGMLVEILRLDRLPEPAEASRYCSSSHFIGSPRYDFFTWAERFLALLQANRYQVLFPITDISNEIVYALQDELPNDLAVIGPSPKAYALACDKASAIELAAEVGIGAPRSRLLTNMSEMSQALEQCEYPLFVKPTRSAKLQGDFINVFKVQKCWNRGQLEAKLTEDLPRVSVLLQQSISGPGAGLNFCADHGRLLAATMTLRLHEPLQGGGSSYRANIPIPTDLLGSIEKLSARLQWSGLMMVELKRHGEDDMLMEMNCRPWGSIETAIKAGVDFPFIAVQAALGKSDPRNIIRSDRSVRVRNLKADLGWVLKRHRQWLSRPSSLLAWLRSLRGVLHQNESFDLEQRGDPLPALFQFNTHLIELLRKFDLRRRIVMARLYYRYRPIVLRPNLPLLFLCRGNINRSVVAEKLLKAHGFKNVQSAGTLLAQGRGISGPAARFLEGQGINASTHRSTSVFSIHKQLADFQTIVVFDFRTWAEFSRDFPNHAQRLVLFEQIAGLRIGQLFDPHGKSSETYQRCFSEIHFGLTSICSSSRELP
jgi:predicted ATP-grasp superfamily ATP-dependent carboligase/protein-tyrosine-phosphatase